MNQEFQEALDMYQALMTLENEPVVSAGGDDFHRCCGQDTVVIDSHRTCTECGRSVVTMVGSTIPTDNGRFRKTSVYKRTDYFVHLLRLMTCQKGNTPPNYCEIREELKKCTFATVGQLKSIMKKKVR
jgi:hypothetical protein